MFLDLLSLFAGLTILYFAAEFLVRGASSVALQSGIKPLVVGLTVIALGTSMPEFVVNVMAINNDSNALALGNIIGSNIANIGLILGISALIRPLEVASSSIKREFPIMIGVMGLFYGLAYDGSITFTDGIIFTSCLVIFMGYVMKTARAETDEKYGSTQIEMPDENDINIPHWQQGMMIIGGMVGLTMGANLMVTGAVNIASSYGISEVVIGITIVAIGTSLPELATSAVGAYKGETDLAVGNILGSNIFNVLFVVGIVTLMQPLPADAESIGFHFPAMIFFAVLLLPLARTQYRIGRLEGAILLVCYVSYMTWVAKDVV